MADIGFLRPLISFAGVADTGEADQLIARQNEVDVLLRCGRKPVVDPASKSLIE